MLDKQFRAAEEVYLQSGDVSSAIKMYEQFCMYEEGEKNLFYTTSFIYIDNSINKFSARRG